MLLTMLGGTLVTNAAEASGVVSTTELAHHFWTGTSTENDDGTYTLTGDASDNNYMRYVPQTLCNNLGAENFEATLEFTVGTAVAGPQTVEITFREGGYGINGNAYDGFQFKNVTLEAGKTYQMNLAVNKKKEISAVFNGNVTTGAFSETTTEKEDGSSFTGVPTTVLKITPNDIPATTNEQQSITFKKGVVRTFSEDYDHVFEGRLVKEKWTSVAYGTHGNWGNAIVQKNSDGSVTYTGSPTDGDDKHVRYVPSDLMKKDNIDGQTPFEIEIPFTVDKYVSGDIYLQYKDGYYQLAPNTVKKFENAGLEAGKSYTMHIAVIGTTITAELNGATLDDITLGQNTDTTRTGDGSLIVGFYQPSSKETGNETTVTFKKPLLKLYPTTYTFSKNGKLYIDEDAYEEELLNAKKAALIDSMTEERVRTTMTVTNRGGGTVVNNGDGSVTKTMRSDFGKLGQYGVVTQDSESIEFGKAYPIYNSTEGEWDSVPFIRVHTDVQYNHNGGYFQFTPQSGGSKGNQNSKIVLVDGQKHGVDVLLDLKDNKMYVYVDGESIYTSAIGNSLTYVDSMILFNTALSSSANGKTINFSNTYVDEYYGIDFEGKTVKTVDNLKALVGTESAEPIITGAYRTETYSATEYEEDGKTQYKDLVVSDKPTLHIGALNISGDTKMLIAEYAEDGSLMRVSIQTGSSLTLENFAAKSIKIFTWDMKTLAPKLDPVAVQLAD